MSALRLAFINVMITFLWELFTRHWLASYFDAQLVVGFFTTDSHGSWTINRQSLINITMTFFVSLLGFPIYYFRRRRNRYLFFLFFGVSCSLISQILVGALLQQALFSFKRFAFDFSYNATLKFLSFEAFRLYIRRNLQSPMTLGMLRIAQDLSLTSVRILVLSLIGLNS